MVFAYRFTMNDIGEQDYLDEQPSSGSGSGLRGLKIEIAQTTVLVPTGSRIYGDFLTGKARYLKSGEKARTSLPVPVFGLPRLLIQGIVPLQEG